jgi:hypothetical protein
MTKRFFAFFFKIDFKTFSFVGSCLLSNKTVVGEAFFFKVAAEADSFNVSKFLEDEIVSVKDSFDKEYFAVVTEGFRLQASAYVFCLEFLAFLRSSLNTG